LLDFEHPEGDATLTLPPTCFTYHPVLGKKVFWHSSAHVLGEATERHYGCHLCLGPPTDDGFFYEMAINDRWTLPLFFSPTGSYVLPLRVITHADYPLLEKIAESAIKDRQKFERLVVSKEKLQEMFYVSGEAR